MNTKSTLILASIALALLAYIFFFEDHMPGTLEKSRDQGVLMQINPEEVNRVELRNPEGSFVFVRDSANKWMIDAPVKYPAASSAIEALLSDLEFSRRDATLAKDKLGDWEEALKQFGLTPGKFEIQVHQPDNHYSLALGNETARKNTIYGLLGHDKKSEVVVLDASMETSFQKGLNEWRDPRIFSFLSADVNGLSLKKDGLEVEVVKEAGEAGHPVWRINKPLNALADDGEVTNFLTALLAASARDFVADSAADIGAYGLTTPMAVLEVRLENGKAESIRIGSEDAKDPGSYYAQLSLRPTVFKIDQPLFEQITGMMDKIRDRRAFQVRDFKQVKSLVIRRDGHEITVKNHKAGDGTDWYLTAADGSERMADKVAVETFINQLKAMRAETFEQPTEESIKKNGLVKPAVEIEAELIMAPGLEMKKNILISVARKEFIHVKSDFRSQLLAMPEKLTPLFPDSPMDWYAPVVEVADPQVITGLSWEKKGEVFSLAKQEGKWPEMTGNQKVDASVINRQLLLLKNIPALEWRKVADKDFGPVRFKLTIQHGDSSTVLLGGKLVDGGLNLCRIEGRPEGEVFAMSFQDFLLLSTFPVETSSAEPPQG